MHYDPKSSFLRRNFHAMGYFYMRHRKAFAMVKVILLAIVMTFVFSVWTNDGKVVRHSVANTFAGGGGSHCGDGQCLVKAPSCVMANGSDCSKINTGTCPSVAGCSINTSENYTCGGTSFSCSNINNEASCTQLGCSWNGSCTNVSSKGGTVSEICSSLNSSQCSVVIDNNAGDCSILTSTTESCGGTITTPTKESTCTDLHALVSPYGISAAWDLGYTEDADSCPADCVVNNNVEVTIQIDMSVRTLKNNFDPYIDSVVIIGSFNGWDLDSAPILVASGGNPTIYYTTLTVTGSSSIEYKFLIGRSWDRMENRGNRSFNVTNDNIVLPIVYFSDDSCGSNTIEGSETCDDGNLTSGDGCSNTCVAEAAVCNGISVASVPGNTTCDQLSLGDPANQCAGYYSPNGMQCSPDGKNPLACIAGSACTLPAICGDGTVNGSEICDDGNKNGSPGLCNDTCDGTIPVAICGNRSIEGDEVCDDGDRNGIPGFCNKTCSAPTDAADACIGSNTRPTGDCSSITIEEGVSCGNFYDGAAKQQCSSSPKLPGVCIAGPFCETCGNGICESIEDDTNTCSQDCTWPELSYAPSEDKGLTAGPVVASVSLPTGCTITNNSGSSTYSFKYNGYFIFQISCTRFAKPRNLVAKVGRVTDNSVVSIINNKDFLSLPSGGEIYYQGKDSKIGDITSISGAQETQKQFYSSSLLTFSGTVTKDDYLVTNKDISFQNDPNVYKKIVFEKSIAQNKKAEVAIPADVILKKTTDGIKTDFNTVFVAPTKVEDANVIRALANKVDTVETIIKAGDADNNVVTAETSSGTEASFTMTIETDREAGTLLEVFYSQDGNTWEYYTGVIVQSSGDINYVSFEIPHLTYYGLTEGTNEENNNEENVVVNTTTNGGGGGGSFIDVCTADRDCTNSYYNQLCGPCSEAKKVTALKNKESSVVCYSYSSELNGAYAFAFANSITTVNDCTKANIDGELIRSHMAKMVSNFAINTLGLTPNTGMVCNFTDISNQSSEMKFYAKLACQLGLMGLNSDGTVSTVFTPDETVSRAQFGTILSRLIRGGKNNGASVYYTKHLQALKDAGIMTKIDTPNQKEIRGFVMLMMQRVVSQVSPAENGGKTLWELIRSFFSK